MPGAPASRGLLRGEVAAFLKVPFKLEIPEAGLMKKAGVQAPDKPLNKIGRPPAQTGKTMTTFPEALRHYCLP